MIKRLKKLKAYKMVQGDTKRAKNFPLKKNSPDTRGKKKFK